MNMPFTFVCEKCGRTFGSKVDPSGWRHKICNGCSGKPYKDYPVDTPSQSSYTPRPVPTTQGVQYTQGAAQIQPKKEFDLESYIADMLVVYSTLKRLIDENRFTIPEENICSWVTSIMIQKEKMGR